MPKVLFRMTSFGAISRRENSHYCLQVKFCVNPLAHFKDKMWIYYLQNYVIVLNTSVTQIHVTFL